MKSLINTINESKGLSALYLKNENDSTWTITDKGKSIKDIGGITVSWDPHSGIYFIGSTEQLIMFQKAVKEETIIEENVI